MLATFFSDNFPPPKSPPEGITVSEKKILPKEEAAAGQDLGISNEPIWFLYRDNTKHGPFRYLEMVRQLQTNTCGPDDFVWKPSLSDWMRIRHCSEFNEAVLRKLAHVKNVTADKIFMQRKFPRVPYDAEVIVHDDARVIFGSAKSISEGGAFLEVPKVTHAKGDRIKVHFTPGGVATPFNCIAEVTQISKGPPTGYNVKFIYIEEDDRKRISDFAESSESGV